MLQAAVSLQNGGLWNVYSPKHVTLGLEAELNAVYTQSQQAWL
jgi:hypothetical protein